jgi:hypothetical protein
MADQPQDKTPEIIAAINRIGEMVSNDAIRQEIALLSAQIEQIAQQIAARPEPQVSGGADAASALISEAMNMISDLSSKVDNLSSKIDNLPPGGLA